ncbi:YARHG domain-containing protein [Firmicutes bacterium AM55-24TS]|nr:YARHG domain-containing protein [Firmicutes bacterium AM55-24TS]RHP01650.1 YARHG domain-containing protein [Firmicutes bacterium AF36-3BH]
MRNFMTLSRVRMKCSDFRKGEFIMKKIITLILVGCMALSIGGCATEQDEPKSSSFIDSNNMDETNKIIAVKSGYIYSFSDEVPVGPAIDSFLHTNTWKYFKSEDNMDVVQCTGNCMYNDKKVEAKIQFVVNDDDSFEVNSLSLNDIDQELTNILAFLGKAYEYAGVTVDLDDITDEIDGGAQNSAPQNSTAQTSATTAENGDIGIIDTDDYNLDEYYISDTILDKLSQDEVRTLLNAMYAHYGYTFTTEQYAQFFSSKPWYSSRGTSMSDCESMFNDYERKNKETITAYESRKGWR